MKKTFAFFLFAIIPLIVSANGTKIDGIYYNLNAGDKTASVTYLYYNTESNKSAYSGNVVIPSSVFYNGQDYAVTSIDSYAFARCTSLLSVSIPNSVTKIGSLAFGYCSGLLSVYMTNSVALIDEYTFIYCNDLPSFDIPNSVKTIGKGAFYGCESLASVTIPNSVTSIGDDAFNYCRNLLSVSIPNSVTSIGENAFWMCGKMTSVSIPSSLKSIGTSAFELCSNLKKVYIENIDSWCNISFSNYSSNPLYLAHHIFVDENEITNLVIPNSVTSIKNYAFYGGQGINTVTILGTITSIGNNSFYGCSNMSSISIPSSVKSIGEEAFYGCKKLSSVNIPENLSSIKKQTFYGCSGLKEIDIPSKVEYIYQEAFANCNSLEKISVYSLTPPFIYENSFTNYSVPLYVPIDSYNNYKTAQGWKNFTNIYTLTGEKPTVKKCSVPTINYIDGKLIFSCETEGAICHSRITDADINSYETELVPLTATYDISVYATLDGYEASDVAEAHLCWIDAEPKTEGISGTVSEVRALPVLVQCCNGILMVSGASDGTIIGIYNTAGVNIANQIATGTLVTIPTTLNKGEIAIVKIDNKAIKVLIK